MPQLNRKYLPVVDLDMFFQKLEEVLEIAVEVIMKKD
jgi:hypothetical protein